VLWDSLITINFVATEKVLMVSFVSGLKIRVNINGKRLQNNERNVSEILNLELFALLVSGHFIYGKTHCWAYQGPELGGGFLDSLEVRGIDHVDDGRNFKEVLSPTKIEG